jgi:hypothetical protein
MKNLGLAAICLMLLASCYSKKLTRDETVENFIVRAIPRDSADIYMANYEKEPAFKQHFKRGMYIPMEIIDAIKSQQGLNGIMVYYGKSPEFKSPVFILFGTTDKLQYRPSRNYASPAADNTYLVYYPCPTQCGK